MFPNMLWAGRAYYPSKILPVMPEVKTRGDQLKQCADACKKYGIELHAWKVNWNLSGAPNDFIPKLRQEGRLQADQNGREVVWLCPSDDRNWAMERDSMLEVIKNYPVQGIHFDYIRFKNSSTCYCANCRKRFAKHIGQENIPNWPEDVTKGPHRAAYLKWRQSLITRLVRSVSEEARKIKPDIKLGLVPFSRFFASAKK